MKQNSTRDLAIDRRLFDFHGENALDPGFCIVRGEQGELLDEGQWLHLSGLDTLFVVQRPELYRRLSDFPDLRAVVNYPSLSILLANLNQGARAAAVCRRTKAD
jgi:hypothetical protein